MFIFFPVGTDAPLYHLPWATGAMVLVNIAVFVLQCIFPIESEWFMLHWGTLNPIAWFTVHLMHADIGHLLGNMLFLVICGIIIEGKVGWLRFLFLYFAIGVTMAAPLQLIMLFPGIEGYCVGASGVISGMIVISMLWAPENHVKVAYGGIFFLFPFGGVRDVTILGAGFFMIAMNFVVAAIFGFRLSSQVLHLIGVVAGVPFAYMMLKFRQVNCDGFDMFSLWSGNHGKAVMTHQEEKQVKKEKTKQKVERKRQVDDGLEKVNFYIKKGHYDVALKRFEMIRAKRHSVKLTEAQLVTIIKGYDSDRANKHKSIPVIEMYLKDYETYRIPFTLMQARTQVLVQHSPRKGLKTLKTLGWDELNPKQQEFVRKLIEKSKSMIAKGILEVD